MRAGLIAIFALLLAVMAFNMGLSLQGTLLGVRAGIEQFDLTLVGIIMSSYFVGFVAGSVLGPQIVNRVGHIRAFTALAALGSIAVVGHGLFVAPAPWILCRALTGFCFAGMCMVIESWLNQRASSGNRGTVLSLYMMATYSAAAGGQLLLNAWTPSGTELFILASILMSLSLVPVALTTSPAPPMTPSAPMSIRALYEASPVGVVGCFATGLLFSAMGSLGAVFGQASGLSTFEISLFMTLIVLGGTLSLWPAGRLSDRIDRRHAIAALFFAVTAIGMTVFVATIFAAHPAALFALVTLYGAAAMPIYGIANAHANDKLANDQFVPASSTLLLCYGAGAIFGPLFGSVAMQWFGPTGLFAFLASVGALGGTFVLWRTTRRAAVATDDKTAFVPVPGTTSVALELAPIPDSAGGEPAA